MCIYGQGVVRELLEEFQAHELKGFAVWLPTMPKDSLEPSHTSRSDLGRQLHWEGLLNMTRKRGEYTIEHVREAFDDSKTVRGV